MSLGRGCRKEAFSPLVLKQVWDRCCARLYEEAHRPEKKKKDVPFSFAAVTRRKGIFYISCSSFPIRMFKLKLQVPCSKQDGQWEESRVSGPFPQLRLASLSVSASVRAMPSSTGGPNLGPDCIS